MRYYRTVKKKNELIAYGAELISNGGFDDTSGWTFNKTSTTISGGVLNYSAAENLELAQIPATIVVGKTYRVAFTVLTGTCRIYFFSGGGLFSAPLNNITNRNPGDYEFTVDALRTANFGFYIYNDSVATAFTLDNISVKEVL